MTKLSGSYCIILFALSMCLASQAKDDQDKQVYIVYMGSLPTQVDYTPMSHHISILQEVTKNSSIANRMVRSYKRSFNGFAAWLTKSEKETLQNMEGVVSVFPNKIFKTQTTWSWDFMGLEEPTSGESNLSVESDLVIGVIDTGIWPESHSFSDQGFGPPPKTWRGACEGGKNFSCNNKLIGARHYIPGNASVSARDDIGHGSHTASTAAGNMVKGVSFFGLGYGTARGGVPSSRIAAYKVCSHGGCSSDSILSAFDDAIADNVDVITISIGAECCTPFEEDTIAIGAFHAMANGILTVNSAGNSGPAPQTVSSVAPWMFTVAASNTNRAFVNKVVLGNGKTVVGRSVNTFDLKGRKYPLIHGKSASSTCNATFAGYCYPGCLDKELVKGKIVMCDSSLAFEDPQLKEAIAAIVNGDQVDLSFVFGFPVSVLTNDDYNAVLSYFKYTKNPKAAVLKSEAIYNQTAPVVVSFSSRGPNTVVPDLLKPDITAPGVEILAAFSPEIAPSFEPSDKRHVKYSVLSGTSMSCPHAAGVAAFVKSFHPNWSPSMIQSAIMTTAWPMIDPSPSPGFAKSEFAYGAGHVNPVNAITPGLVYEFNKDDHITFLCGLNYTVKSIQLISGDKNIKCFDRSSIMSLPRNLNYPSLTTKVLATKPFKVDFYRTVTNVGLPNSTYKLQGFSTSSESKVYVEVVPEVLSFKLMYEKKSFKVTVSGEGPGKNEVVSVDLVWSDGVHSLRSPIVVYG